MNSAGSDDHSIGQGRELERHDIQIAALMRLGSQRSKKLVLGTPSGTEAKVKRGVKQELALPLKRNLLVSFQDCQNALMTA